MTSLPHQDTLFWQVQQQITLKKNAVLLVYMVWWHKWHLNKKSCHFSHREIPPSPKLLLFACAMSKFGFLSVSSGGIQTALQSLISPVLKCASSFNRFDYPLDYISLAPVYFHPAIRLPLHCEELMFPTWCQARWRRLQVTRRRHIMHLEGGGCMECHQNN